MLLKRMLMTGLVAMLLLSGGLLYAQDTAATAEPTAEAETEPAAPSDLTQEVPLNGLIVNVPEGWSVIPGQEGDIIASNIDMLGLGPNAQLPPDAVLVQINLFNTSQLPAEIGELTSAKQILEGTPTGAEKPEVTEVQAGDATLARMVIESAESDTVVYAMLVNENTFLFAVSVALTPGMLPDHEATIQAVLANLEIDTGVPLPEDALTRYEGIPQSVSPEGFPQLGNPDAPVKLQEISSFACPACRSFHDFAMTMLLDRIKAGEVLFEYIPYIGTGHIANNEQATAAALCAGEQDLFWQYHDALFGWQDFNATAFLTDRLYNGAEAVGLDMEAFHACMDAAEVNTIIENAVTFGNSLAGFVGTPTVLLNGAIVNWNPEQLAGDIDAAIEAQANATTEPAAEADSTTEPTAEAGE